jgi:hypothetical protein
MGQEDVQAGPWDLPAPVFLTNSPEKMRKIEEPTFPRSGSYASGWCFAIASFRATRVQAYPFRETCFNFFISVPHKSDTTIGSSIFD